MSSAESMWSFGLLGTLAAAMLLFRQAYLRTSDYDEARKAKARLPLWVHFIEKLLLYFLVVALGCLIGFTFNQVANAGRQFVGANAIYLGFGSVLIAFPIGGLLANLVSWLLPPLRKANEAAMASTQVSFLSANRGFIRFSIISIPVGIVTMVLGSVAPWAK